MQADKQTVESIRKVMEYLHADESLDFEASDEAENHIYRDIKVVEGWLNQQVINRCVNCGSRTKYPNYCTKYPCRQKAGTESMYNVKAKR